jgi:acyl-CoA thioester hydrolase
VQRTHEYKLQILEFRLDTFGHVNNAAYLSILEEARWDWITSGGYGVDRISETGQGPTILECKIRFKRELRNRDFIVVRSRVDSYRRRISRMVQTIENEVGEVCCEAEYVIALFDLRERKLIAPTEAWLAAFGLTLDDWRAGIGTEGIGES